MRLLDNGCPCSGIDHPPKIAIPPAQASLAARQQLGFREIRRALLAHLNDQDALTDWRADPRQDVHQDLGVMLLDFAAYVLAVTGFYDARIAERSYLAPAPDAETLQELVALIGYIPRPAMVSRMRLALETAGNDPVNLPELTAFRSDAFDGEAPQIFEALHAASVWPARNRWILGPVAEQEFNGTILFGTGAVPHVNAVLVFADETFAHAAAGLVTQVSPEQDSAGRRFNRVRLDSGGAGLVSNLIGLDTGSLTATLLRLAAGISPYASTPLTVSGTTATLYLDAVYGQLRSGDPVAVELGDKLYPGTISDTEAVTIQFTRTINTEDITQTVLQSRVVVDLTSSPTSTSHPRLHFAPAALGALKARSKEFVVLDDLLTGTKLVGPIDSLGDAPQIAPTILQGALKQGAEVPTSVTKLEDSSGMLTPQADAKEFPTALKQPIQAFGNVIEVTRGETVLNEVLGSSDGQRAYQRYALKKKPLSWIENSAEPSGRSPFIDVAVDGIRWGLVRHLTLAGPEDRVFALRTLPDGTTEVCFGDGVNGAIPASGVDNVVALNYRFGGGVAKPPPGAVSQFKRPVREISRVRSPLPATGGADAEGPDELRRTAPDFALTLGRAVSVADFEAMARAYSGILNAHATWAWQASRQKPLVRVSMIPDVGDPSADLEAYLEDRSAPGLGVEVRLAQGQSLPLAVDVLKAPEFLADDVEIAVETALLDPFGGALAPRNIEIGAPLMRSVLMKVIHDVPGVEAVKALRLDGVELVTAAAPADPYEWFDFSGTLTVGVL